MNLESEPNEERGTVPKQLQIDFLKEVVEFNLIFSKKGCSKPF